MALPTHLLPRAVKNLVPGYRRRWRISHAALLNELQEVVPTLIFGESDGVPWIEEQLGGLRLHGFWTEAGDARIYDDLRPDLPSGLKRPYFRLARDYLTRFRYPHLRPDLKPMRYPVEGMTGFHGQHKDTIADLSNEGDRAVLMEAFCPKSGEVIIDCGAFLGFGDIRVSPDIEGGRIYAVEASADCQALLERNVSYNGCDNIVPVARAVWNEETTLELESGYAQANSLIYKGEWVQRVQTITIDELVEKYEVPRVDMLSFTLNGAEVEALGGAAKTLLEKRPRVRLPGWYKRDGRPIAEIAKDILEKHSYRVFIGVRGNVMALPR